MMINAETSETSYAQNNFDGINSKKKKRMIKWNEIEGIVKMNEIGSGISNEFIKIGKS